MSKQKYMGGPRPNIKPPAHPHPPTVASSTLQLADEEELTVSNEAESAEGVQTTEEVRTSQVILTDDVDVPAKPEKEETPLVTKPKPAERMVRITMAKDHSTVIGGVRYNLQKDKTYTVPVSVARILQKSPLGLLRPNF